VSVAATLAVVLGLAGGLVLVNNYVGYVPNLGALFQPPGAVTVGALAHAGGVRQSRVVRLSIPAPGDGIRTGTTYVYLPPGYSQPANLHRRYPVVYLIHGYPGRAQDWFTAGGVQRTMDLLQRDHYIGPMIVVSPTASTGYLDDSECLNAPGRFAIESYLAFDVVDTVDRTFRTVADRAHRAIGGMSSGGYCALNVGLHHLHRFSVILASEPYGSAGRRALHQALGDNWPLYRANAPAFFIPLWHFTLPVASFLDSGGKDRLTTTDALRLAELLAQRGQPASYRPAPHQHHNWREARAALPYALVFAWQHFGTLRNGGSDAADAAEFARILHYAQTLPPPRLVHQVSGPSASPSPLPSSP
jgi:enterochelin esterase-like enzyme